MNLLVGALCRAIQAAADDGWTPLVRRRLVDAADAARRALRTRGLAISTMRVFGDLRGVEREFVESLAERLVGHGAALLSVQVGYGTVGLKVRSAAGDDRQALVRILGSGWCSNEAGVVVSDYDLARRMSLVRIGLTKTKRREQARENEKPDAQPKGPARRGRGRAGRPDPSKVREAPRARRL